jgi:hypothetical protein
MSFLSGASLYAEDNDPHYTDNHINGRFWNKLDFSNKLYFLYGMIDGVTLISEAKPVLDEAANIRPSVSEMILRSTGRFFVPSGTYKEVVEFIDELYSKDTNLDIPVYAAYAEYLGKQKDWKALKSWDEALEKMRR